MNSLRTLCLIATPALLSFFADAAPLFNEELIFPEQDKHVHGSSVIEASNGDLIACWFHGSGERTADDVKVQGSRLRAGETEWEPVFLMADTPDFPDCNPVLFIAPDGKLWLFWILVQAHRWECSLLAYRTSTDYLSPGPPVWNWNGVIHLKPGDAFAETMERLFREMKYPEGTWAEHARPYTEQLMTASKDPYKRQTGWMPRIHPLVLQSGRILLPLYSDGFNVSLVAYTDDLGERWHAATPIIGSGPQQPSLIQASDGRVVAYMRDTGDAPFRIQRSESRDEGITWSIPEDLDIPNGDSSLEIIALREGYWMLVCNDTVEGRERLTAYVSDDEGASWKWRKVLKLGENKSWRFDYPSVIQGKDGRIHVTCTSGDGTEDGKSIRHLAFNTEWLLTPPL